MPKLLLLLFLLGACGPTMAWRVHSEQVLGSRARCLQGPVELRVPALGSRYGEAVKLEFRGPRHQGWYWEVFVDETRANWGDFPGDSEMGRCSLTQEELDQGREVGTAKVGRPVGPEIVKVGQRKDANIPAITSGLEPMPPLPKLSDGTEGVSFAVVPQVSWTNDDPGKSGPLPKGALLRIRLWNSTPNEMSEARFVLKHLVRILNGSEARWSKQVNQEQAAQRKRETERLTYCNQRRESTECWGPGGYGGAVARMRTPSKTIPFGPPEPSRFPDRPPPPPLAEYRPTPPSQGAEWIPGYWLFSGGVYGWVGGRYRISPIAAAPAPAAPAPAAPAPAAPAPAAPAPAAPAPAAPAPPPPAPPPPKVEQPPPPPSDNALWAGGHWDWNGQVYIWIDGSWLLRALPVLR